MVKFMPKDEVSTCWCGNHPLVPFSDDYARCGSCETLVLKRWGDEVFTVRQDEMDFYGKSYWFEHQENDLGFQNIVRRARTDLPERVLHWLSVLLKYKLPPGNTLELGCAHGGFVFMLHQAGFSATGLEMSSWVTNFAREAFGIPMLLGEVEKQALPPASLDAIMLFDVLEHLPNPLNTLSLCFSLLKPNGILLIQTPQYVEGKTHQQMLDHKDPFLTQFKTPEHVYLFSRKSATELFNKLGAQYIAFETSFFSQYDMFFVVSRCPLMLYQPEQADEALMKTPGGRLVLALLDKETAFQALQTQWRESEADRGARLDQIHQYDAWLKESETDRAARLEVIKKQEAIILQLTKELQQK
jgi:2-polyprenyl-3-methyl-5-hydroxy-6-metoxy-1,4-benzoquinol methylase